MSRRSPETLADYLVVAICPALIMLLVGSLMWFLVEVFYQGEFKGRLLFVMGMFVLAIVGIARSSMERGMMYAPLLGAALAAVIALALAQFVKDGLLIGGPIMLLVWWVAHKLTWDCTLLEDAPDASGEGLLQQMGLDPTARPAANSPPGTTARAGEPEATTTADAQPEPPWWERLFEPDRRPHAPGVWVIYFSLAALPLFGVGGWFVPASDPVGRAHVFGLLVLYVASGMGLLLATSFLGLRRYLRQRKLEMPMEMTTTWILAGIIMIFAMLITAAILPRPRREYSLSQLPFTITSAVRSASRYALGKEGTKDDAAQDPAKGEAKEGQNTERQDDQSRTSSQRADSSGNGQKAGDKGGGQKDGGKGKAGGNSDKSQSTSNGGKSSNDAKSQSSKSKGGDQAKGRSAESQADKKSEDNSQQNQSPGAQSQSKDQQPKPDRSSANQSESPPPARSSPGRMISNITSLLSKAVFSGLQLLFYAGLLIAGLIAAWIYREELKAAWQKLLAELRELWNAWFGAKKAAEEAPGPAAAEPPPVPFAAFADPFATGDAGRMPWPQLVRYTFDALEAWGREQGCPRSPGQTPQEFATALAAIEPQIASQLQALTAAYHQLAYAQRSAAAGSLQPLRELWQGLRAGRANLAVA